MYHACILQVFIDSALCDDDLTVDQTKGRGTDMDSRSLQVQVPDIGTW